MKKFFNKQNVHSLRTKLILSIVGLITFISFYVFLVASRNIEIYSIKLMSEKAKSISLMTAYSVRAALDFEMIGDIEEAFKVAKQNKDLKYIVLKNAEGKIVYSFNLKSALKAEYFIPNDNKPVSKDGKTYRVITPVKMNEKTIGNLYLGLSLSSLRNEMSTFRFYVLIFSSVLIIIGIIGAFGISRIVTKPLQKLIKVFEKISEGDLTGRAEVKSKDELGKLAGSFNIMVESLEFAMNEMEGFNQTLQVEIQERKKAEDELRKLTEAIVHSPVSMLILNNKKIIEYANPKFLQTTGYSSEDIIGRDIDSLSTDNPDDDCCEDVWDTLYAGKEWRGESLNKKKSGEAYWELVSMSPITDAHNLITHFVIVKEDITERKLYEETTKKYDFIVNTSKEFMSLINRNYEYEAVNEAYCKVLNKKREEIIGLKVADIYSREVFDTNIKCCLDKCFEGEEVSFQAKVDHFGGKYLDFNYYPYRNGDGEITHVAAVAKDITQQKKAEQVLKESEERYKGLVSNLPDLIIVHKNNKIVFANTVVYELLGYTANEVIGKSILDFVAEEYKPKVLENVEKRIIGEPVKGYEIQVLSKSGDKYFVEIRGGIITYDSEPATLNVIVNINERKKLEIELRKMNEELEFRISRRTSELTRAVEQLQKEIKDRILTEESLRESEERFRALADNSKDFVMRFDNDFKCLSYNKAARQLIGKPIEEILGKSLIELGFTEKISDIWTSSIQKVIETKDAQRIEYQTQSSKWFDAIFSPEISKGKVKSILASIRDITELKLNEYELIQAKEHALEASRLKSEFLANMSHEIRTPMNAIIGFTDLLSQHIHDKKLRSFLDAIKSGGKNLLTLINDILDLSKIEAGKMEIVYEPVNPYLFINETKDIFAIRIAEKNLDFILEIDPHLPESLFIDEVRLRQVLFNLIGNAVKFTDKGYIKLVLSKIYKQEDKSTCDLVLCVEDTGIGIPPEAHAKIFESFKQLKGQNTKSYGGTGLGLAITKRLVEMMNGDIFISSEVGKGSKFEIILHDVSAASVMPKVAKEKIFDQNKYKFEKAKVLIADDIELNRNLLKEFFSETVFEIYEAENGLQVLQIAREIKPDLILMDIRMPLMSGFEANRKIKEDSELKHIPVVAITASAMKEDEKIILSSGFDGYLVKPVQVADLYHEIIKFLKYELTDGTGEKKVIPDEFIFRDIKKIPEILYLLEQELLPLWEKANSKHFIQDVLDLANKIKNYGTTNLVGVLQNYGDDLIFYSNNFDIENMNKTLQMYPGLITKLKDLLNKN